MARLPSNSKATASNTGRQLPEDAIPPSTGNLDGVDNLGEISASTRTPSEPPRSLKAALDAVTNLRRSGSDTSSEASEEDYDNLKHDSLAVVKGGRGGGYIAEKESTPVAMGNEKLYEGLKAPSKKSRPKPSRLFTLDKLKENGRYILTADDEAIREILKLGLERVRPLPKP